MNSDRVKEIVLKSGVFPASEEARKNMLNAVKTVIDELLEEVAQKIEDADTKLVEEQDYMLDANDCTDIIRWFKSGSKELFECKHETKLGNSKTGRIVCADCGASLNGRAKD